MPQGRSAHDYACSCRLLGLEPEVQSCIFDFYQAILDATIAQARREGRYDDGIVDVSGTAISLAEDPQVSPFPKPFFAYNLDLHVGTTSQRLVMSRIYIGICNSPPGKQSCKCCLDGHHYRML